jgi:hypothetical protein
MKASKKYVILGLTPKINWYKEFGLCIRMVGYQAPFIELILSKLNLKEVFSNGF